MKAGAKTTGATRLLWSLVLGLGLVLGLLWVMMPRSAAEAQTDIGPGLIVEPSSAVVRDQAPPDDAATMAQISAAVPPISTPAPMPPRPFSPPLGGRKGGTPPRNPPALPSEDGPSPLPPASARIPEGTAPASSASSSDGYSGAAAAPLYATKGVTGPHIRLEKNEDYYDAAGVVITQVTSLFIDEDEAWSRYQSGELDTIAPPLSALDEITSGSVYSSHLHVYPGGQCTYYYGFSNDVPPFDNPQVRAAFASAIDRPRLISETGTLSGDELPALTFTPPGSFGHVDGYAAGIGRPYSPTLAMDLLVASGYTGTPTITLMYNTSPGHQAIAEAVRQMWIDTLGITVTLQGMEWGSYLDLLNNGSAGERPGIFRLGWCADYPDANNWHNDALSNNWPRYNNPAYDAVVSAAATETLSTTRLSLYEQAESYLVMTDTAISPLYHYINHDLTRPDLDRTYRSLGGQHLDEWTVTSTLRPLEIAWGSPATLDPARASDSTSFNYVEQLFLGLTDFDETGAALPELATSWEVSADAAIYTFTMRSDVTWTNSISVVTAYDVEYGVLRSLDPATGCGYAYVLYIIENAQDYNEGNITDPDLVGVEALDDTHIRFTLREPAAYFPVIAGFPPARPQPRWAIEAHGSAWTDPANIVTNGPYRLAHWDQMPYLRINKWGDGDPMAGSTFVFNIQYWNDGGVPAENSVITDTMLGGMTYISDTSPFTHTGSGSGPIVWYLGTLSAHTSGQFEVHVQVTAAPSQTITNQAQIATSNPDDQGDQWEKESEWSGHVEGPRMRVDYANDFVGAVYPAGHTFWLTVTDSGSTVKATASLSTTVDGAGHGYWGYDGFVTESDNWSPSQPDIQPDDRVHFQSDDGYTNTIRVGDITGELDVDADTVSGTISAPWFTQTLQGHAGAWGFDWKDFTVDPAGGSYFVHFSEDLQPGWSINVEYIEPDGDEVINIIYALDLIMDVNYGHDWVEGNYETGHTVWITVTESDGSTVKGTAELTTGAVPWWGGRTGFSTNWQGWSGDRPDIVPGDYVYGLVDNGYTSTMRMGAINGELDVDADTISGTIHANWFTQTLDAQCGVWAENGPWLDFTVDPAGGSYFCDFGAIGWDLLPGQDVPVKYREPDGGWVYNVFQAPALIMTVDYEHEWVNGNYEAGHTVWITLTENDSSTIKATAVLTTGPIPGWGGQSGFETQGEDWSPEYPDIQPGDWVFGLADDGYSSEVQVGTINGGVDADTDVVSGTIHAPWLAPDLVTVNCEIHEENGPSIQIDNVDPNGGSFFCDFGGMWDIQPGHNVAANYTEPDADRVQTHFYGLWLEARVNQSHNWVEGETTPDSTIVATVWRDGLPVMAETTHNGGGTGWNINFPGDDDFRLQVGDVVEVQTSQGLTASVEIIPMTGEVDADADTISGTLSGVPFPADVRGEVWTENGTGEDGQTDGAGNYTIDFGSFDVLPGHMVALWYVQPDGHQVGIVHSALRLNVRTARDAVEGETRANVPVTVTVNSETVTTTSDAEGRFWTEFATDITATDTVEAWAGTGTQHASLVVETVTAYVDDAHDKVWGYGPPNSRLNVSVNGDWRETTTDNLGYYEVQYDWDITPNDEVEVEYNYPSGHQTRYGFGPPDVRVHKWAPIWNVVVGDEYSYFIEYSNDTSGPATDVVITDTLPYSVTYVSDTSGVSPAIVDNTIVWNLGAMSAYRSETFELRVQLNISAPLWTNLRNTVEISAPNDRNLDNNWGKTDVNTNDQHWADLWVDKSLGRDQDSEDESPAGLPIPGEVITYQLHYGNNGSLTANNVVLTDTLPVSTTFVGTTFEVGVDGLTETVGASMVVWNIGTLPPGESRQFELAVQIDGGAAPGTLLVNELAISSSDVGEGDHRDDWFRLTTVVEPSLADLWVDKEMWGDFSSLENEFTYRITFQNDGTLAAQDVVLVDTLPVSMTQVWHSAGSAATLLGDTIVWDLGTVPPGGGGQLLIGVRVEQPVPAGTFFTNTVEASTSTPELDYDNNVAVDILGPPKVICVPWIGPRPHRVWPGLDTTLKGTAKGYGLANYEWDPGDGSPVYTGWVGDPYVIEANHIYNAPVGTVFTATLTVWGAFGWSDTDTYAVQVFSQTQGVEVDVAVDEGLWYVHKSANRYQSGGLPFADWRTGGNGVAETASAVQAFQVQGHRPGGDPWEDPYVENVQRGWNALFTYSKLDAIGMQPAGDPDSNGNGVGIGLYSDYNHSIYEAGLAMMALASTGSPGRVAHTGPPIYVRGQTYHDITQDMADWFAWGQNDDWSGTARGGWRYQPNSGDSDNSNTQFPVLGLAAAEDNWSIAVPTWVKSELRDYWLAYTQNPDNGGFGYTDPYGWTNVGKTGAGIMDLAWTGVPVTDTRIISAAQFIEAHWYDTPGNWDGNVGEIYAMYAVKKGSQLAGIHQYGSHFWQTEYDAYLVGVQWADGHFDDAGDFGGWQPMATSWAVMILSPGLYRPLPVPIISPFHFGGIGDEWNDGKVRFDASLSHHTDPDRTIILYEWDFGDGSTVVTTPDPIITHTYGARNVYVATLTVWDDVYDSASRATQVNITAPDSPPVADPNGPYSGQPGQEIILDGSGSYDPDEWMGDEIVLYEWDIAGGSLYTTTQPTLPYTWLHPGVYSVILRVQDRGADYGLDSPRWSDPEATVAIIGPVADLSLTKSDSPDPVVAGESLTYTLVVANDGLLSATNVILTDTLPPGVTFAWATAGCTESGGVVTCDLGNLDSGATVTVTIVVTPTEPGTIVNFAIVAADECDSDPTDNAASQYTVVTAAPVLDPIVVSIAPDNGFNDVATDVAIEGSNFQSGATASLDGSPLQAIMFVSDNLLGATVPAGLTPGTYDLTVVNPDARSGILLSAFTVLAPTPPIVADVIPSQGPNDTPVTVDVYGSNFAPGLTATLNLTDTQVNLEGLLFIDSTHLRGIVPIYVTPGVYTLTVTNTDGRSGILPNAYEVIEAATSDELYANDTDLWLRPSSVRRGDTSALGLTVRRQGGQTDLTNVAVDFYEGDPLVGGNLIGTGTVPVLPPYGAVTTTVSWTPAAADTYVLYAVIDPANAVTEDNEANNVISRTVTVLPPVSDVTPPQVISFTINGGAANTSGRQVYLSATASDDPGGSGVAGLFYIEYEFVQSVADWVPVASSGWLPYASASTGYPWLLQPGAGVRYLQVWAADAAGNISLMPAAQMINYLPPMAHVAQGQIHIFRQRLTTGQSLRVRLTSFSGDADLYIWAPDGTLVEYSWAHNPEVIEFTAMMAGAYQIEVEGWTPADYRLEIIPISVTQAQVMGILRPTARGRGTPYVMPGDTPSENVGLPSAPVTEYRIFLPLVMRQK